VPYGEWEPVEGEHNFYFTSEVRLWFEYTGDQALAFLGDDDVWIFINRRLALDLGGIHAPLEGSVTLDAATAASYELVSGSLYELVVFQAERHVESSSYMLSLTGFDSAASECVATN
jgi:fibro-slime domain-containing protein